MKNTIIKGLQCGLVVLLLVMIAGCGDAEDNAGGVPGGQDTYWTVTYNANGGSVSVDSVQVKDGTPIGEMPVPVKSEGDTVFWGWYTKNGLGGDWGDLVTKDSIARKNLALYARWGSGAMPVMRTVTFDANGGTVTPSSKQVLHGTSVGELPVPVKQGWEFSYWLDKKVMSGSVDEMFVVVEDVTLFAIYQIESDQWCQVFYYYNYPSKEGELDLWKHVYVADGQDIVQPEEIPEYSGYTFAGWYADKERTIPFVFGQQASMAKGGYNVYAKWEFTGATTVFEAFDLMMNERYFGGGTELSPKIDIGFTSGYIFANGLRSGFYVEINFNQKIAGDVYEYDLRSLRVEFTRQLLNWGLPNGGYEYSFTGNIDNDIVLVSEPRRGVASTSFGATIRYNLVGGGSNYVTSLPEDQFNDFLIGLDKLNLRKLVIVDYGFANAGDYIKSYVEIGEGSMIPAGRYEQLYGL